MHSRDLVVVRGDIAGLQLLSQSEDKSWGVSGWHQGSKALKPTEINNVPYPHVDHGAPASACQSVEMNSLQKDIQMRH